MDITQIIKSRGLENFNQVYRIAALAIKLDGYTIRQRLIFAAGVSGLLGFTDSELAAVFTFCCDNRGEAI